MRNYLFIPFILLAGFYSWSQMLIRWVIWKIEGGEPKHYNTPFVSDAWGFVAPRMQPYFDNFWKPDSAFETEYELKEYGGSKIHRLERMAAVWASEPEQVPGKAFGWVVTLWAVREALGLVL